MKILDFTGLDEQKVKNEVKALSELLANMQVFYANLRGLHWNVRGRGFFHLHSKYEELYNGLAEQIDGIAERLLQLDVKPENRYSEYLKIATIQEDGHIPAGRSGILKVLDTYKVLMAAERELSVLAEEAGDRVTAGMMDELLGQQEKDTWMFVKFLDKKEAQA